MGLSVLVQNIQPSITFAIAERAKKLKSEGVDIISFAQGEPDFNTPQQIKEAAIQAINEGFTRYTPVAGIPELKEAISIKLRRDNGLQYDPANIIISNGGKQVLYNAIASLAGPGDEIIIPTP
jgi:aspartate aminotransferase